MLLVLMDFSVIKPDIGLLLWSLIFFLLFWGLIGKYAFRPIAEALKQRDEGIQDSLDSAKKAREEVANMKMENDAILMSAREERATILKEAKDMKMSIVNDAKTKAKEEAKLIVLNAKEEIEGQRISAMVDAKNKVGEMAIDIAEKILRKDLKSDSEQVSFANKLAEEMNLN